MPIVIISSIIGIFFGYMIMSFIKPVKDFRIDGAITGGCLFCLLGLIPGFYVADRVLRHEVVDSSINLAAVHSEQSLEGAFVWGDGHMASRPTYNFLARNADGSLSPGHVLADEDVRIFEDADLEKVGYLRSIYRDVDRSSPAYFWSWGLVSAHKFVRREFRIPAGSIVPTFDMR